MTFRLRILLSLALVGLVPLSVMGVLSYTTSRGALDEAIRAVQRERARALAVDATRVTTELLGHLGATVRYLPLGDIDTGKAGELLRIPFRQFSPITLVGLFDDQGQSLAPPVMRAAADGDDAESEHEPVYPEDIETFSSSVPPLELILKAGAALGVPYRSAHAKEPRVALGVVASRQPLRLLLAEVSLGSLAARARELANPEQRAVLASDADKIIVGSGGHSEPHNLTEGERAACADARTHLGAAVLVGAGLDGSAWLSAATVAPGLGWCAVVSQSAVSAFAPAIRLQRWTVGWTILVIVVLLALGLPLARTLTGPIGDLSRVTAALGAGDYTVRAPLNRADELGKLASTINAMADGIQKRNEEIRNWNRELQKRVDERTLELELIQEQVRRSERLTALATLSAGVAHELNNPLTGVVTLLPLLRADVADRPDVVQGLDIAIGQAQRIRDIVAKFRTFVEEERTGGGVELPLGELLKEVVASRAEDATRRGVQIDLALDVDGDRVVGQREPLRTAFEHLVDNAILAMPNGGRLRLKLSSKEGKALEVAIADNGIGIAKEHLGRVCDPFFSAWPWNKGSGMGLALATKAITAQGGTLRLESTLGEGTTVLIVLPRADIGAHLV